MVATQALQRAFACLEETIEMARQAAEATARFSASALHRAAIYRSLVQVQAMAYNFAVAPSVAEPRILVNTTYQTDIYTLGLACQDFFYGATFLDGRVRYRLHGRLGATRWASVQVQSGIMGAAASRNIGDYNLRRWADEDGHFDIIAGPPGSDPSILPLDPASRYNFLWIRRILMDWSDDHGELIIERLDSLPEETQDVEEAMAERIRAAADFAGFLVNSWAIGLYDQFLAVAGGHNRAAYLGGAAVSDRDVGSPQAHYASFVYKLEQDQVLLIEGTVPSGVYWGIQLGDVWSNSLDFLNHQADLNMSRIAVDRDGRFRAIVSPDDPGIANWLDCCGHREGVGMIRLFEATERPPLPDFRVIHRSEIDSAVPVDSLRISPDQRRQALAHRRTNLIRLYGE